VRLSGAQQGKFCDKLTPHYSILRLVLIPGAVFLLCKLLGLKTILTGTAVLLSGMPASTLSVMLTAKYGGDALFASRLVIFTTLVSLVTTPLWCIAAVYL